MRGAYPTRRRAALAALAFCATGTGKGQAAPRPAGRPPAHAPPWPVQGLPDPELRARALIRQFPWITRFWAELRGEERGRAERAFRRAGQSDGFEEAWDRMGLQDRVLLLFGPGRGRAG